VVPCVCALFVLCMISPAVHAFFHVTCHTVPHVSTVVHVHVTVCVRILRSCLGGAHHHAHRSAGHRAKTPTLEIAKHNTSTY